MHNNYLRRRKICRLWFQTHTRQSSAEMKLHTRFPLATLFFKHWSPEDTEVGVVVAKASFTRDGARWLAAEAPELVTEDRFVDDPANSPLLYEQDIAPGKIGTDLMIHAVARSPRTELTPEWPVSVTVADKAHYGFHVRGPSRWTHTRRGGWKCSTPELVHEVPISYHLAYGGSAMGANNTLVSFDNNPAGIGFCTAESLAQESEIPAPQIGFLAEFLGTDPLAKMTVHGFGPVAKAWLPRRSEAGTFDQAWQETRHPRMPLDYSLAFWSAAAAQLQFKSGLNGDEVLNFEGVSHDGPMQLKLPGVTCSLQTGQDASQGQRMMLDTVHLDLRDPDPENYRADLVWRAIIPAPERFEAAEVVGYLLED